MKATESTNKNTSPPKYNVIILHIAIIFISRYHTTHYHNSNAQTNTDQETNGLASLAFGARSRYSLQSGVLQKLWYRKRVRQQEKRVCIEREIINLIHFRQYDLKSRADKSGRRKKKTHRINRKEIRNT